MNASCKDLSVHFRDQSVEKPTQQTYLMLPAGYGKLTVIVQWKEAFFVWFSLNYVYIYSSSLIVKIDLTDADLVYLPSVFVRVYDCQKHGCCFWFMRLFSWFPDKKDVPRVPDNLKADVEGTRKKIVKKFEKQQVPVRTVAQRKVRLFNHLHQYEREASLTRQLT